MATDIVVPQLGESVTEATVAKWMKSVGDKVERDEPLCELETDKVTLEVYAPAAGTLAEIIVEADQTVEVGAVLGRIDETGAAAAKSEAAPQPEAPATPAAAAQPGPAPLEPKPQETAPEKPAPAAAAADVQSPAVRKIAAEHGIDTATIAGSGKDGRVTKGDVLARIESAAPAPAQPASPPPSQPQAPSRPGG